MREMDASDYFNSGVYTFAEAAKLLRVKPATLRYWIGELQDTPPLFHRKFPDKPILAFADLMELHFVKMFLDHDVSFQAIRKAANAAAKKFKTNYPFTVKRFDTDGREIFATLKSNETDKILVEHLQHGQYVFAKLIRPFFKKLDYRQTDNEIERYWPLRKSGRVVLDPTRRFGEPIDAETGVPISVILDAVHAGGGQDVPQVANWFEIPVEAVKAAIRFERLLAT